MPDLKVTTLQALRTDASGLVVDGAGQHVKVLPDGQNLFGYPRAGKPDKDGQSRITVAFVFQYRLDKRLHDFACGTWPKKSLKDIRVVAANTRTLLEQGVDPAKRREATKAEARAADAAKIAHHQEQLARPTVRALFEQWESAVLATRKDKGAETARGLEKDLLSALGDRHAADVTKADLMAVLDGVKARGANRLANRILAEIRQMFGFALDREIVQRNPLDGLTKAKVGGKDVIRTRTLSEQEVRALPAVLAASGLIDATKHAVWVLLATSARVGELCKARRADIDLDKGVWRIPAANAKNGSAHVVYLSAFAAEHVRVLLDCSTSDEWVLPASRGNDHVDPKSIAKQLGDRQLVHYNRAAHSKRSADEHALELPGGKWGPHDLRRTSATLAQQCGVLPVVIEAMLNHKEPNRMTAVYQQYDYATEQRDGWERVGQRLTALTTPNVLMMPSAVNQ